MDTVAPRGFKLTAPKFLARWNARRAAKKSKALATDTGGDRPNAPLVALIDCVDISESMMIQMSLQGAGIPFRAQGDSDPFRMAWSVCTIYVGQEDLGRAEEALNQLLTEV